jgi:uncharacterized iron-regulated membrane protein
MDGVYSWMIPAITIGRYQFSMGMLLAAAIVSGVALHWSQRAPAQKVEISERPLATWLRYALITLLSGWALVIVFAPW